MRTKLIGAALLAAGALSAMAADNVYSLNVVGYANVALKGTSLNLVANQFTNGDNSLNTVLPSLPDNTLVLKFVNNDYNTDICFGGQWYDYNTTEPSLTKVIPGEGFFINNPGADATVTFVGEVPQGTAATGNALSVALPNGLGLVGTYTPQALEITMAASGFPTTDNMLYLKFDTTLGDYWTAINFGDAWYDYNTTDPVTVIPAVGQGYFINNPGSATAWVRDFTVGP